MKLRSTVTYFVFLCLLVGIYSCKKEETKPVEKSPLEMLTAHTWQIDEIRYLQQNIPYYYKRGASAGNTANFDIEYIKFNADGSGERSDNNKVYPLTWEFIDAEKTKIKIVAQEEKTLIIIWENLLYKENSLKYSEYYNRSGTNSLAVITRTPKPGSTAK